MADARKDKRTLLSLKIRYKSATLEDFIERYSSDISRGGVFIKAKKPLDVGTLLKFEFLLSDQSSLIHGVGRVVWRREPAEANSNSPAGMGIKFIKMDPESRALVQRIAEGRDAPGVFERGDQSSIATPVPEALSTPAPDDRTKVRHVSEFLASAFEEGGAGEAATREAQAGAQRARQISQDLGARRGAAARGALGGTPETPTAKRQQVPEAASRSAASAFGGSGGSVSQAMAEPLEELDAEEDFLDHETTRIHDYPEADATVVAGASAQPFVPERRQTPVVPARSRLETEVPDLFGPDIANSFGPPGGLEPAPGEFLDSSLLDPAVPTVPPPAGVPSGPGIPVEAFKAPTERAPANPFVAEDAPAASKPSGGSRFGSRAVFGVLAVLVLVGGAIAAWQLGVGEQLSELAAPYIGDEIEVVEETPTPSLAPTPVPEPEPTDAEAQAEAEAAEEPSAADTEVEQPAGLIKVIVRSRPARAFLSVDGKPMGRTPTTLHLQAGAEVTLAARARGYLPKTQKLTVEPDAGAITLALPTLPYFVEIESTPSGARATAVGGGEITTPGQMRFKSMINPRSIVISKDGFETVTKTVNRREFREETRRMVTSIRVTLLPEQVGTEAAPEEVPADDAPEAAAVVEPELAAEPEPEPAEVEAAPEPTETDDAEWP